MTISQQEREDLYKLCNIPTMVEKTLPLIPFHQSHRHKELLVNFAGKRIKIAPKASADAFVVEVMNVDMAPRFLPGTLLVIEPKYPLNQKGFALIYVHATQQVIFRKYEYEDGVVEIKTLKEGEDGVALEPQDKIVGVVTETRLDFFAD